MTVVEPMSISLTFLSFSPKPKNSTVPNALVLVDLVWVSTFQSSSPEDPDEDREGGWADFRYPHLHIVSFSDCTL